MRKLDFNALKAVAKQTKDISSFINEYILDPIAEQSILIDDINKKSDHITISTIHSAKGLESSICYITNVRLGIYLIYKCTNSLEEIEEERRCLYVALTRAKDTLYLISSIQSNSSINNENEEKKHIVDTYNLNNTGIILEYISTYDNIKETESTTIAYRLDTNPKEILYMDESDFLDRFIITENNQQHYFFNNLPENLVAFKSTNNKLSLEVYSSIHKSTRYNPLGDFDFS
jgi:DNA helicase-2/ATP-dependent DNA helicase PcrA